MKIKIGIAFILIVLINFRNGLQPAHSWGFYAHKKINRMAVFTLPPSIFPFYKAHIEFITEHAVDADKRRYVSEEEAPRHYIDIDHYSPHHPFDSVPSYWFDAVDKYTEDTLKEYGILPWHILRVKGWLTRAFVEKDIKNILRLSADIGHYMADAHVPLHTTKNYNGQLTGQKGIHAFWESRLPELKAEDYDYFTGRAKYLNKPLNETWKVIEASFSRKDSVLLLEKLLNDSISSDKKYAYETRGSRTVKIHSVFYSNSYHEILNGMVERRMRKAIKMVGSMWYTAWADAGQPNLNELIEDSPYKTPEVNDFLQIFKKGKTKGREHE